MKKVILILLTVLTFAAPLFAEPPPGVTFSHAQVAVAPSPDQISRWVKSGLANEIWAFGSVEEIEKHIKTLKPGPETTDWKLAVELLKQNQIKANSPLLRRREKTGDTFQILMTPALKAQMPEKVMRQLLHGQIYAHVIDTVSEKSLKELYDKIDKAVPNPDHAKELKNKVIEVSETQFSLPITPDLKPYLTPALDRLLHKSLLDQSLNLAQNVRVHIDAKADLRKAAAFFSLGRDPNELFDFFSSIKKFSGDGNIEVELDTIMPDGIAARLNSFESVDGPNCVGWAACHWLEERPEVKYQDPDVIKAAVEANPHLKIPRPEKAGDLLVYRNKKDGYYHIATYLGESPDGKVWYVSTKDGPRRITPYRIEAFLKADPNRPRTEKITFYRGCLEFFTHF